MFIRRQPWRCVE